MYQIGIISQPCQALVSIQAALLEAGSFTTSTLTQPWRAAHAMREHNFHALLVLVENDSVDLNALSLRLRDLFSGKPIVFLLPSGVREKYQTYSKQTKIYLLNKETELPDLAGILEKAIAGGTVAHRNYLRYATAQNISLISEVEGRGSGRLINLGFEGAQVRVFKSQLKVGDKVRLHVYLPALKRDYLILAKVAWLKKEKDSSHYGSSPVRVGLQFAAV